MICLLSFADFILTEVTEGDLARIFRSVIERLFEKVKDDDREGNLYHEKRRPEKEPGEHEDYGVSQGFPLGKRDG